MIAQKWEFGDYETVSSTQSGAVGADSNDVKRFLVMNYYGDEYLTTVDPTTGSKYADAEKLFGYAPVGMEDSELCWAATASNILQAQGWGSPGTTIDGITLDSEDSIFDYFATKWIDAGGWTGNGVKWWINNTFNSASEGYYFTPPEANSGGFWQYPYIRLSEFLGNQSWDIYNAPNGAELCESLISNLTAGAVVGLSVTVKNASMGHAITCWGYETDSAGGIYLYLSDSDDAPGIGSVRTEKPNTLKKVGIYIGSDRNVYFSSDYLAEGWVIRGITPVFRRDEDYDYKTGTDNAANAVNLTVDSNDYSFSRSARIDRAADIDYFSFDLSGQSGGTYQLSFGSPFDTYSYDLSFSIYAGSPGSGELVYSGRFFSDYSYVFATPSGGGRYYVKIADQGTDLSKLENTSYTISGQFAGTSYTGTIDSAISLSVKDILFDATIVSNGNVTAGKSSILQNVTVANNGILNTTDAVSVSGLSIEAGASASFAAGAALTGDIAIAAPVAFNGAISAKSGISNLTLSLDGLTSGQTLISGAGALSLFQAKIPAIAVDASQAKGTYLLADHITSDVAVTVTETASNTTFQLKTGELYYTENTGYVLNRDAQTGELFFSIKDSLVLDVGTPLVAIENYQATLVWSKPSDLTEPIPTNYEILVQGPGTEKTYTLGTGSTSLVLANLSEGKYTCTVYAKYQEFNGKGSSVSFSITGGSVGPVDPGNPDEPVDPDNPDTPDDPSKKLPDLAFDGPARLISSRLLEITVINKGAALLSPVQVSWLEITDAGTTESKPVTIAEKLAAGETRIITIDLSDSFFSANGKLSVTLDPRNQIEELSESNNVYVFSTTSAPDDPDTPDNPDNPDNPDDPDNPPTPPQDYYPPEQYTPKAMQANSGPTRSPVLVEASFNSDTVGNYYSTNGGKTWKVYKKPVKMTKNGTVLFKSETALGHVFTYAHEVTNIDKAKPILQGSSVGLEGMNAFINFVADGTGSAIARSQLKYKSMNLSSTIVESSQTSFSLNNLAYGKYSYQIRVYDEAGNASGWSKKQEFIVSSSAPDTDGTIRLTDGCAVMNGYVGIGDSSDTYTFTLDRAGVFSLYAEQMESKLKLGIYSNGKKVKTVTAKQVGNGMDNVLLKAGTYSVVVESADKGKGKYNTDYQVRLNGAYFEAATRDDDFNFASRTGSFRNIEDASPNEWVGYDDPSDAYKLTLNEITSLSVSTGANVKIELYSAGFKKLQTGTRDLQAGLLAPGDYYVNIAAADKGKSAAGNTYYNLAVSYI